MVLGVVAWSGTSPLQHDLSTAEDGIFSQYLGNLNYVTNPTYNFASDAWTDVDTTIDLTAFPSSFDHISLHLSGYTASCVACTDDIWAIMDLSETSLKKY